MTVDLATTLALRDQAGAHKQTVGLILATVTAYDASTVDVLIGEEEVTAPRLRSYSIPEVGDTVIVARSGSSVFCLGALNAGPLEPPEEPDIPPPPPPPPAVVTQIFRPTFTGALTSGAAPINPNPYFTTDAAGWNWTATNGWVDGGVRVNAMANSGNNWQSVETDPRLPWADPTARFWLRAVVRVEELGTGPDQNVRLVLTASNVASGGSTFIPVAEALTVRAVGTYTLSGSVTLAGIPAPSQAFIGVRVMLQGVRVWIDSAELFDAPPSAWSAPGADLPQGTSPPPAAASVGAAFYGDGPASLVGTAVTGTVRVERIAGGDPAPAAVALTLLAESTPPVGPPTVLGTHAGPALAPGGVATVALPSGWVQALLDGTAGGIGTDPAGPVLRLAGRNTTANAMELALTYTP